MRRRTFELALALLVAGACIAPSQAFAEVPNSFDRGFKAARSGHLEEAILHWSAAIQREPKCYAAYVNRGTAYLKTGHVLRGIRDWHTAQKYSPIFAYGLYTEDFINKAPGDTGMLTYAKSLEIDPDHMPSVAMIGVAYLDFGRTQMAADLYRMSLELTKNPLLKNYLDHWMKSVEDGAGE
ncbi:MAG: hypothetical protein AB1473_21375 [Thermodesulfobacteriota bacterium]